MQSKTFKKLLTFTIAMLLAFYSGISYEVFAEETLTEENVENTTPEETSNDEVVEEVTIDTAIEAVHEETQQDSYKEEIITDDIVEQVSEETQKEDIQDTEVEVVETVVEKAQEVVIPKAMTTQPPKKEDRISNISSKEQSIRGFVVRLYRNVLGREADEQGFNYWVSGLESKKVTGTSAVKGFFLSNEMNKKKISNTDYIKLLYTTVLNRNADSSGLKYWTRLLDQKMSKDYVVNGFLNSNEFSKLCNNYKVNKGTTTATGNYRDQNYNVTAFVNRMYSKTLNRSSDIAGLEYWTKNLINKKETGATLIKGFFLSKEFLNKKMSDEEFVKIAYRTILDREADKSGLKYWLEALSNHYSRNYILKGFVNSKEFNNLCKTYKISVGNFGDIDTFKTVKSVSVSYLSQDDPRWKNTYFGEYTFGDTGCAETVLAMIYRAHGHNITPTTIGSYLYTYTSEYNGAGTDGAGTSGKGVKYACDYYGYKFVPLKNQKELEDALKSGHVVHAAMGPGIFTNPGYTHAVLFTGYSNGSTYAYDPKHPDRIGWHNINTIYNQKSGDPLDYYGGTPFFMIFK